jgi:hypothetical protein
MFLSPAEYERHLYRRPSRWHSFSPATILRRDVIDAAGGFRRELDFWADTFVARLGGFRHGMVFFPEDCVCFRVMPHGIAGAAWQDPQRTLAVVRAALALMDSPAYRSDFPERYVTWWRRRIVREFPQWLSSQHQAEIDRLYEPVLQCFLHPPPGSPSSLMAALWVCRKALSATYIAARRAAVGIRVSRQVSELDLKSLERPRR